MIANPHADARILVVDDEPANLILLRDMLARAGYSNIETIANSGDVVTRFIADRPDLILLDLHMPPPDGFTLLEQFRTLTSADEIVPILVLTADVTDDTRELALDLGAHDFLTKPFRYSELLLRSRNLLNMRLVHTRVQAHDADVTRQLESRTRVEVADGARLDAISRRVDEILAGEGLTILFQPVVDLREGTIVGAEALSRFRGDPPNPPNPPDHWFLEAGEVGRTVELELYAIAMATCQFDKFPADTFLSINASAETLLSPDLDDVLADVPGWRLVVELTEHQPIRDYDMVGRAVEALRDRGIRLAVDDTGAGYASLHHILRLGPDIIKLDRALITGIDTDPVRRSMVTSLVHFGAETGTQLIGEGIETEQELQVLRALGLGHGQGFLLARPAPLPLTLNAVRALRVPMPIPTRSERGRQRAHDGSVGSAIHDGPMQEVSAAALRVQLLQHRTVDEPTRIELALTLDALQLAAAEMSEIVAQLEAVSLDDRD